MKNLIPFLKSKAFIKHAALAVSALCLVLFISFKSLTAYTDHGVTVDTPDFRGLKIDALNNFVKEKEIGYLIVDSIYDPLQKPGVVLSQDPIAQTKVKPGRVIYLYTNALLATTIEMPRLADCSLPFALTMLKNSGLKAGTIKYEDGDEGLVLKQIIDGKAYTAEEIKKAKEISLKDKSKLPLMIKKGSVVNLTVGREKILTSDSLSND